jgi:hypothetical protein
LGAVVDPKVCRTFVTCYPQFIEGRVAAGPEDLESVPRYLTESEWVASRFPTPAERNSIDQVLRDGARGGNGGVTYLLQELGRSIDPDGHDRRVRGRQHRQAMDLFNLLSAVAPAQSLDAERARKLIVKMIERLLAELKTLPPTRAGKQRLVTISQALRQTFSFAVEELGPLPKSADDLVSYVDTEISEWIEDGDRSRAMAHLGVPEMDRLALLEAVSRIIDREAIVKSLGAMLASMPNAERKLLAHAARFVAALLNNQLRGGQAYFDKQPSNRSHAEFVKFCNEYFPKWTNPQTGAANTPHFQMIVRPMMLRLQELSQQIGGGNRKALVGDSEVAEMLRTMTPAPVEGTVPSAKK